MLGMPARSAPDTSLPGNRCTRCPPTGRLLDIAAAAFISAFEGLPLEAIFLDFAGSGELAGRLRQAGGAAPSSGEGAAADGTGAPPAGPRHVLCWAPDVAPPVLPAWDFGHVFFGMLRTPGVSIPEVGAVGSRPKAGGRTAMHGGLPSLVLVESGTGVELELAGRNVLFQQAHALSPLQAYAIASRAALAHSAEPPAGADMGTAAAAAPVPPPLPQLLPVAPQAALPSCASVAAPAIEGADLSNGVPAAFPGYGDMRLLAPNAELRLLLAGISAMVNPHNLRWG